MFFTFINLCQVAWQLSIGPHTFAFIILLFSNCLIIIIIIILQLNTPYKKWVRTRSCKPDDISQMLISIKFTLNQGLICEKWTGRVSNTAGTKGLGSQWNERRTRSLNPPTPRQFEPCSDLHQSLLLKPVLTIEGIFPSNCLSIVRIFSQSNKI